MIDLENIKHVVNGEYIVIPIETGYIKPNEDLSAIIEPAKILMEDDDYLVIAETPISVSQNRLVDESKYTPSLTAKFLTTVWSKYLLGICFGTNFRNQRKNHQKFKETARRDKSTQRSCSPAVRSETCFKTGIRSGN